MGVCKGDYRLKLVFFWGGEGCKSFVFPPIVHDRAGETRVAASQRSPTCAPEYAARTRGMGADRAGLRAPSARC